MQCCAVSTLILFNITMKSALIHIRRLFLLFLALQILNLSFDSIEFEPIGSNNTIVSFNDLNTAIEYVSEVVLKHDNAFPEYSNAGKSSQKNYPVQKQGTVKLYFFSNEPRLYPETENISENYILINEKYTSSFFREITPPPPKS